MTSPTPNQKSVSQILGELAGAASLCWMPRPIGVFDSTTASKFVDDATKEVEAVLEAERKVVSDLHQKLDMLRDIVHDDVPHQYQTRLLEALKQ